MGNTREVITEALQFRAKNGIKVRQPLSVLSIKNQASSEELTEIIKDELNVKEVKSDKKQKEDIVLDTNITPDLKLEGQAREIIRFIQAMRREADYEVDNRIEVGFQGMEKVFEKFGEVIQKEVLANKMESKLIDGADLKKEFSVDGEKLEISIKK